MRFFVLPNIDMESDSYSYSDCVDNPPKEIPELIFLPDNPIINVLLGIERNESSKLNPEQWDSISNWNEHVENIFRNILEKQVNRLLDYNLPKELTDQILALKEDIVKPNNICTSDLEERLYYICKTICELDTQYYS